MATPDLELQLQRPEDGRPAARSARLATSLVVPDLAAAFQEAVVDVLATKTVDAAREHGANTIALAGGVASNLALRQRVSQVSERAGHVSRCRCARTTAR